MKKKSDIRISTIFIVFLIFAVCIIFITLVLNHRIIDTSKYFSKYNTTIKNNLSEQLKYQSEIDKKLKIVSSNGKYSLNKPFLLVNPYKISPLSAIVIFNTIDSESIDLYINEELVASYEESVQHIIPIVGLLSDTNNFVKLVSSSGEETTLEIGTEAYDRNIYDFDVKNVIKSNSLLLLGNLKSNSTSIRGFDRFNNLNYYLDFDYISGISLGDGHLFARYSTLNNGCIPLILEMDYLGRIYSLSANKEGIVTNPNLVLENEEYITMPIDYTNMKFNLDKVVDEDSYVEYDSIKTESIIEKLDNATTYDKKYKLNTMGEYIYLEMDDEDINLLLVNQYNNYTYSVPIKDNNLIKIKRTNRVSLYIEKDDKYYSLSTILEN